LSWGRQRPHQRLQGRPSHLERRHPHVFALLLEQVEGEEGDRRALEDSLRKLLPAYAELERRKRQRRRVAPREQLAVEHGTVWQEPGGGRHLREPRRDHLLAAGPDVHFAGPPDDLRADAVPL